METTATELILCFVQLCLFDWTWSLQLVVIVQCETPWISLNYIETFLKSGANPIELFTHLGRINKVSKIPNQYLNKIIQFDNCEQLKNAKYWLCNNLIGEQEWYKTWFLPWSSHVVYAKVLPHCKHCSRIEKCLKL